MFLHLKNQNHKFGTLKVFFRINDIFCNCELTFIGYAFFFAKCLCFLKMFHKLRTSQTKRWEK